MQIVDYTYKMTQKDFEKQATINGQSRRKSFSEELVVSSKKYSEVQRILLDAGYHRRKNQYEIAIEAIKQLVERLEKERQQRRANEVSLQTKGLALSQQQAPIKTIEVAYYLLAQAYLCSDHPGPASMYYQLSIKENTNFEPAYRQLATFFYRLKQYNKALRAYQRWTKIAPERGEIWIRLADIYSLYNQPEVACKLSMKALSVGTKDPIDRLQLSKQQEEDLIVFNI